MSTSPVPSRIPIAHDDHHAKLIGRLQDGRQFFVTTPFVPGFGPVVGREFIAVYVFDAEGALLEARIDDLGERASLDEAAARRRLDERVAELGRVTFEDIEVRPFQLERFGVTFGLIPREPETDDDDWWVELEPGNYMAFHAPWEGDYDT